MSFTVAIDGPAAAGKGTLSRGLANHFGFAHLDTGLLYRAVGARFLDGDAPADAAGSLTAEDLARGDLRTAAIGEAASQVAAMEDVRTALVTFQRDFAMRRDGAVLDGRDIGTVICPEAEVKLFVTASADIRALRRFRELSEAGAVTTFETVLADVEARDKRDSERAVAPLKPAKGATELDTSDLDPTEALARAVAVVETRLRA